MFWAVSDAFNVGAAPGQLRSWRVDVTRHRYRHLGNHHHHYHYHHHRLSFRNFRTSTPRTFNFQGQQFFVLLLAGSNSLLPLTCELSSLSTGNTNIWEPQLYYRIHTNTFPVSADLYNWNSTPWATVYLGLIVLWIWMLAGKILESSPLMD